MKNKYRQKLRSILTTRHIYLAIITIAAIIALIKGVACTYSSDDSLGSAIFIGAFFICALVARGARRHQKEEDFYSAVPQRLRDNPPDSSCEKESENLL